MTFSDTLNVIEATNRAHFATIAELIGAYAMMTSRSKVIGRR